MLNKYLEYLENIMLNQYLEYLENIMLNQFHLRPGQLLRVPGGWSYQISKQSIHEGGKVVSPTHRPPLPPPPPGNIPGTHFCWACGSVVVKVLRY
jgi:hypothetical protein